MDRPTSHAQPDAVSRAAPRSAAGPRAFTAAGRHAVRSNPGALSPHRPANPSSAFKFPTTGREGCAASGRNRRPNHTLVSHRRASGSHDAMDPAKPRALRNPVHTYPTKLDRPASIHPSINLVSAPGGSCDRNRPSIIATSAPDTAPDSVSAVSPTATENAAILNHSQRFTTQRHRHHAFPALRHARAVARFVAHSVALSLHPKTAKGQAAHSPSTTCNHCALQQPTRPHRKIYGPCCNRLTLLGPSSVKIGDICG
jgi:hypothetical protein